MSNILRVILVILVVLCLAFLGYLAWNRVATRNEAGNVNNENVKKNPIPVDPLNASYIIENNLYKLQNGRGEFEILPGSAEKIIINVFGQPVFGDLNGDGVQDSALILQFTSGGSGIFYYTTVAIKDVANDSTLGLNAILLGDRIAPQNILIENGKIIANFAQRKPGESFSVPPSVGTTKYFSVSGTTLIEDSGK